jgi:hypothetical protein
MQYKLYDTTEGLVIVYENYSGRRYWLNINNKYDMEFDNTKEFKAWLKKVKAVYIGIDHD